MAIYLSVITPCYNGEKFIRKAVESVMEQGRSDVEMIVVDDGSKDGTADVCRELSDRYAENFIYIHTSNHGAGHARNVGVRQSSGTWVAYLDADDIYEEGSLNDTFMEKLHSYENENVDIIMTPYTKMDMELTTVIKESPVQEPDEVQHHICVNEFWANIYRRSLIVDNDILFYEYQKQDVESAFRYKTLAAADKVISDQDMRFILQRNNLQSNTHTWNKYNLFNIKAKIYYDLFLTTKHEDDKEFLMGTVVQMVKRYYKLCVKHGYMSKDMNDEMYGLLKNAMKTKKDYQLSLIKAGWFATGLRKADI